MLNAGANIAQAVVHIAALPLLAVQQVVMQSLHPKFWFANWETLCGKIFCLPGHQFRLIFSLREG